MSQIRKISIQAKMSLGTIATFFGFASDVVTPLLPLAQYIFIVGGLIVVCTSPYIHTLYGKKIDSPFFKIYFFVAVLSVLSGVMWGGQALYESKKGALAHLFPSLINEIQSDLGIVEKVNYIGTQVEAISKDVSDLKTEVNKKIDYKDIIAEIENAKSEREKEKILLDLKKYDFETLLSGDQVSELLKNFSNKQRVDVALELAQFVDYDLTSTQFFKIITPKMGFDEFGFVAPHYKLRLKEKLKYEDYFEHLKNLSDNSTSYKNKMYQAHVLAESLEPTAVSQFDQ